MNCTLNQANRSAPNFFYQFPVFSCDCIRRILTHLRLVEGEDYLISWDAQRDQFLHNSFFGAIMLNPHFAAANVDMFASLTDAFGLR